MEVEVVAEHKNIVNIRVCMHVQIHEHLSVLGKSCFNCRYIL